MVLSKFYKVESQLHKRDSICSYRIFRSDIRGCIRTQNRKWQWPKSNSIHLCWTHADDNEQTFPKTFELYKAIILLVVIARVFLSSYEYAITTRLWVQFNEFTGNFFLHWYQGREFMGDNLIKLTINYGRYQLRLLRFEKS